MGGLYEIIGNFKRKLKTRQKKPESAKQSKSSKMRSEYSLYCYEIKSSLPKNEAQRGDGHRRSSSTISQPYHDARTKNKLLNSLKFNRRLMNLKTLVKDVHSKYLSCEITRFFSCVMKSHTIFCVKNASHVISHEKIFFVWWKITRFFMWMNVWWNEAIL